MNRGLSMAIMLIAEVLLVLDNSEETAWAARLIGTARDITEQS